MDKKGFSNPREHWYRTENFKKLIFEILNSMEFKQMGFFNQNDCINKYIAHLNGKSNNSKDIWKFITFFEWYYTLY